jgi:glycosyltransferase involved in cell wall biosynthesis
VHRPLFSIVTPTLNRRELLEWTLRSIRGQSYPDLEHVVVDGGSTDGTLALLAEFEGTYPLRWISEPDGGMYNAINKGLRMASGDILAYLNSDDLYFPWTVETVVDAFGTHPDADFVVGDALKIDDATGRQDFYWTIPFNLDHIRRVGFLAQPTVFMRRAAFESEGPFDESLRYVADCEYWMRAGVRHRFLKVNEFLAVERNHSSTLRESRGQAVWAELDAVRSRFVRLGGPQHERRERWHGLRSRLWHRLYWSAFLFQASVPARFRRGPWTRFLGSGQTSVQRGRLLVRSIPRLGPRLVGRVLEPSRYWLEPPG